MLFNRTDWQELLGSFEDLLVEQARLAHVAAAQRRCICALRFKEAGEAVARHPKRALIPMAPTGVERLYFAAAAATSATVSRRSCSADDIADNERPLNIACCCDAVLNTMRRFCSLTATISFETSTSPQPSDCRQATGGVPCPLCRSARRGW